MKASRILVSLFISLIAALAWSGCADECVAGTNCTCSGTTCDVPCGGDNQAGCNLDCTSGATCTFDCPGGSCNMNCDGAASCELRCGGGSCNLSCTGTSTCKVTECKGSCNLQCGGASTCSSVCDAAQSCQTSP